MDSMKEKILKTAGCLTLAEEFKFLEDSKMKTKSKLLTGVVAGLSFLALPATGALAATFATCAEGEVVATGGGGFHFETGSSHPFTTAGRSVRLRCGSVVQLTVNGVTQTWDGSERKFWIPGSPDKDGLYAAALTALATGKLVRFELSTPEKPVSGTTKGQVKVLEVLNVPVP